MKLDRLAASLFSLQSVITYIFNKNSGATPSGFLKDTLETHSTDLGDVLYYYYYYR